jgi:hypothetical protein
MSTVTGAIAGTDGVVPIWDQDARWTQWKLKEIFFPAGPGANRYVPNVGDWVIDTDTREYYEVEAIDATTMEPTLKQLAGSINDGQLTDSDKLIGMGPGTQADTLRVYQDQNVMPYSLTVDQRLRVAGSASKTAIIFKGSVVDGSAKAISAVYDAGGTLLGQAIPLEQVKAANGSNPVEKSVPPCSTTEKLADGEVVTLVCYGDTGKVTMKQQMLVENSGFIPAPDAATKYITDISLESPFLSSQDPQLIQYPLNVPLNGMNLVGVVHYSDGSKIRLPVDQTKFSVFGWNTGFVATVIGQKIPLVLKYAMSDGEVGYSTSVSAERFITKSYSAVTVKADGAYTVKLFAYPVWVDATNGYRLEWFLFNLDRATYYRVTPYVKFGTNSPAWQPTAYGTNQRLSVQINLQDVNGAFKNYLHTQTIDIALLAQGTERTTNWNIAFSPGQSPRFGVGNAAKTTFVNQNLWKIDLSQGEADVNSWLQRLYWLTEPLSDASKEAEAPTPDYFSLLLNGQEVEFPIVNWQNVLQVSQQVPDSSTLFIKFFKRTNNNDQQLAIAAVPVYQQN